MYKQILVAIDGSSTAQAALKAAIRLAKEQSAALRAVHVVDSATPYIGIEAPAYWPDLDQELHDTGQQLLEQAKDEAMREGINCETSLVDAAGRRVATAILEDADQWRADLVVVGAHGHGLIDRLLLGSVSDRVVRTSNTAVLVVR